ncbi:hypothetical protein [Flavobacterium sp. '19STA2R22 D10 B1']|uniref:hypothetical protein n=1 Tax=Flavobacterium aerium TaxID=3037261 RepID=UPI00278C1BBE|nr:hypothetical protein [Flavobacterium sp. '19STA2R22 D10 B1']
MKKNKLSELTIEELNNQKKTLKGILIGMSIVMLILISVFIYLIVKKQNFTLIALAPVFLFSFLPSIIQLSQINTEIKLRNSK